MKIKNFINKLLLFSCFSSISVVFSQKTEVNSVFETEYHRAVELYNNKAYQGAQEIFKEVSKKAIKNSIIKTNSDYYDAMASIKLNQPNADEKVVAFIKNNPYNNKKERIFLNVGNYYFANRQVANALQWYTKIDTELLNTKELDELNYKMGYAFLVSGYLTKSKNKFTPLLNNPIYGNDARYYYGYISYKQNNYEEAEKNLSQLANDATYKSKANYYLLDIAFKNGKFKKATEIGKKILPKAEKKQKSDISKIVGESYFNLKKYKEAIPFLLNYKGKKGKWNNTDYYYLGYAYYKQKEYENAIKYFTKIINGNNKVAQNAYYHLAECYLKTDKKSEALNAFKNAGEMNFDTTISSDADFNYAKLSYEEGNPYKSVPEVLKEYLAKYPNSNHDKEISSLLITSYLYQRDYQGAIDYLSAHRNPENNILANEVSLYRGIQLFNEQKIQKALPHFLIASESPNEAIKNKANFWMAESDYLLGKYQNALDEFLSVNKNSNIEEISNLNYNIAYSYFKLKDYTNSAKYFKKYLDSESEELDLKDDAKNRLGDSYFAIKKYESAIKTYQELINTGGVGADYAQYQKAMSNGLSGRSSQKITDLLTVISKYPKSKLSDDALFQLAGTYTTTNKNDKALNTYDKLIKEHPKSSYIPNALLREGLLLYNQKNNTQALVKFKKVAAAYPNSNEAKQAVKNARNIYIDIGKVDQYANWVKTLPYINVSDNEIDNATFQSAENKFLDNKTSSAIAGFKKYLAKYPNGLNILKANFYLAQSYVKNNQKKESIPHYKFVLNKEKNEYSEESLAKLSQIYLKKNNWDDAIKLLERLENEANYPQNIIFAQSNLMKGYYKKKKYEQSKTYAKKVLENTKISQVVDEEAKVIIARSAIKTNDFITAEEYYSIVDATATGEMKAETLYYKAFFLNESKLYDDSNKEVQNLIANYSTYKYWGVKSYIIMAKNHYALKDAYQATYILENIIKNFTQFKDLVEEAKNELHTIKSKEAKTNESVKTQSKI